MGKSETKKVSTLDRNQQAIAKQLATLLMGKYDSKTGKLDGSGLLGKTATKYSGRLAPAYSQSFGGATVKAINANLTGSNKYDLDPSIMEKRFKESVVKPSMQMYRESIAPAIAESFGSSGGFSSRLGSAQTQALSNLTMQNSSDLANMQWNAEQLRTQQSNDVANRQFLTAQFANSLAQNQLSNSYSDFLRTTPESSPYYNLALGAIGNQQIALTQQKTGFGQAVDSLSMGLGALALL